jgi:hypothetical protein
MACEKQEPMFYWFLTGDDSAWESALGEFGSRCPNKKKALKSQQ